jgi:hypothetical protein
VFILTCWIKGTSANYKAGTGTQENIKTIETTKKKKRNKTKTANTTIIKE